MSVSIAGRAKLPLSPNIPSTGRAKLPLSPNIPSTGRAKLPLSPNLISRNPSPVTDAPFQDIGRKRPARGVHIGLGEPTIVFLTVCTRDRMPWLTQDSVHDVCKRVWQAADAWLVGFYLLMPDHIHLFCAPRNLTFTIERWITYWHSQISKAHKNSEWRFQSNAFHHRLRQQESYSEEWDYVRMNPVRKGLVQKPEDWPFQGMLNILRW